MPTVAHQPRVGLNLHPQPEPLASPLRRDERTAVLARTMAPFGITATSIRAEVTAPRWVLLAGSPSHPGPR
jgi:hypothetical protein